MLIFKTSGKTFKSVIENQKHAFKDMPSNWFSGEIVLISKNKKDLNKSENEKQICFVMELQSIQSASDDEINELWPNNKGRWKYLAVGRNTQKLKRGFNLVEIIGVENAIKYNPIMTYGKIDSLDEEKILNFIHNGN